MGGLTLPFEKKSHGFNVKLAFCKATSFPVIGSRHCSTQLQIAAFIALPASAASANF